MFGFTWRSIVYGPAPLAAAVFLIWAWMALLVLPLLAGACAFLGSWRDALDAVAVWLLVLLVYRCPPVRRFIQRPPSYL